MVVVVKVDLFSLKMLKMSIPFSHYKATKISHFCRLFSEYICHYFHRLCDLSFALGLCWNVHGLQ